ncbi:mechanosensitive ion channel family protein [Colwellia sp. E2M01]|uniref:mechanosensitive ion channel family protein n=1 Tax=Colwellia sp. E2M01 TaxID=2841561 RepID=UPI001C08F18B|nr:mechanosensitive ion channel family protein [Colwellia sp. E2M01]MBU2871704.1 mechanosensitive ion channel family protein [Colwellia sp. E2M01]
MSDKANNTENITTAIADTAKDAADISANLVRSEIEYANKIYQIAIDFFTQYSFQLVGAFLIFLFGLYLASKIAKGVLKLCEKKNLDITLSHFVASLTKIIVMTVVVVIVLSKVGVSVTPLIAAIGAASFGAVLALQGLLSNYVAGFNIIMTRPFVVEDTIEILGVTGIVKEVRLGFTLLKDEDGALITIPNKHIVGEVMLNSQKDSLLKLSVGISYQDNPLDTVALIERTLSTLDIYTNEPRLQVGIDEFADSAINIGIRLWIPTNNLYEIKYAAYKAIYLAFEQEKITIPFPQQDIHIIDKQA